MTPERLKQLRSIVEHALDQPRDSRGLFLDEACVDDPDLRRCADDMLAIDSDASAFMELPENPEVDELFLNVAAGEPIGKRIGPYLITQVLAAGGMGTVYRAVRADESFEREVAIKLINRGGDAEANFRRFHAERQLLANLDHPNIARLLDGGATPDGRPFIVMEFIEGRRIDRDCDARALPLRERLRLFVRVCGAVHHAHQNLIVHRDIKPGNILVTGDGEPKLLDFGISRLLDGEEGVEQTAPQRRILTPQYASPEQVRGESITTAADVYSLGVVLYELVAGGRPYELTGLSSFEREHMVCELEPVRPSMSVTRPGLADEPDDATRTHRRNVVAFDRGCTGDQLRRQLRGDIDNIVLKALAKDPLRRYATVMEFAADIERHLDGLPVEARAATFTYAASKFVRRNRRVVATVMLVVIAVLGGVATAIFGLDEARVERNSALIAKSDADEVTRFLQDLIIDANPYRTGREVTVTELLDRAAEKIDREFADRPGVQARLHYAIAQTHAGMWRWRRAAIHAERALGLNRELHGHQHALVAECLSLYGRALTSLRDPRCADVQREALTLHLEMYGEDHPLTAQSYGDLGFALWHGREQPRWTDAEWYYREAIAKFDELQVEPNLDRARFLYGFADMQAKRGIADEAELLYREAGDMYRALADNSDLYMIECLRGHAKVLLKFKRYRESRALLEEVLDIMPALDADPVLADTCWQLGKVLQACGENGDAEGLFRRAIRTEIALTDKIGDRPVDLATAATGFMLTGAGDPNSPPYAEIFRSLLTYRHDDGRLMDHFGWLAGLLSQQGRIQESAALFDVCSIATEGQFGEDHWRTALVRGQLAACLADLERYEQAERMLMESYHLMREQLGARDLRTRKLRQQLFDLYESWGHPERMRGAELKTKRSG